MLTHFVQAKTFPNNNDVLKMTFLFLMAARQLMHTTTIHSRITGTLPEPFDCTSALLFGPSETKRCASRRLSQPDPADGHLRYSGE